MKVKNRTAKKRKPPAIFSGDESVEMWKEINGIRTLRDTKWALYTVCCKLQEMESRLAKVEKRR